MVTPELDSKDTKLVTNCIDAGIFRAEDPTHIGGVLWAATHGAVSLEPASYEGHTRAPADGAARRAGARHRSAGQPVEGAARGVLSEAAGIGARSCGGEDQRA
jgi:hypothetical protein